VFDTHVHLDLEEFAADRPAVLERARQAGIEGMVCVGITADSSRAAIRLAEEHSDVYAAVGIQPNYAAESREADWPEIVRLAEHPRVVAIGETGLDRHWDFTPFAVQEHLFERHLRLARDRDLPVLIHCRDAWDDVLRMLRAAAANGPLRGLMHAFSGDAAMAGACLELGLDLSFAGNASYPNQKFASLRAVAAAAPADRLLLETDSPYLVPHPLRGRQKRNEPSFLAHTAASLAELRGVELMELDRQTTANARRLFRLDRRS